MDGLSNRKFPLNVISSKPDIDVCIATYKRPELLRKLLNSLAGQETSGRFSFRIIVVDNDAARGAEPVIKEFLGKGPDLVYDVEPEQNISLARNRCLTHATADYVAIIDDDEYADDRWLLSLYTAIMTYEADLVRGPIIWSFPPGTPDCVKNSALFIQPNPPTGSTDQIGFFASNSLLRRKLIEQLETPFDPAFGKSGGEDVVFFAALKKRRCKITWCGEAIVFESLPAEKADALWICRRFFRNGNITYRMRRHSPIGSWAVLRSCNRLRRGICALLFYIALSAIRPSARLKAAKSLEQIAFQAGFLAAVLKLHYDEYASDIQVSPKRRCWPAP
jgi:succinoglycan biosynthesis protein ExoM